MTTARSLAALLLIPAWAIAAEASPPAPGRYIREFDSGTLEITRDKSGKLGFEINTIGGNCHMCGITGSIDKNVGHGDPWANEDSKCYVSFTKTASGYDVKPTTFEECRPYCGARAGFDGEYKTPPKGCGASEQEATRAKFADLYRAKEYARAAAALEPLVAQCREFINWIAIDEVRNDLALAELHSGNAGLCLKTLQDTAAWDAKDEEALKGRLPPCDFDNYVELARKTWFNRALCEKATRANK